MKFHALALCLAGTVAAVLPAAADHDGRIHGDRVVDERYVTESGTHREYTYTDSATGISVYAGERLYAREVLWPDLQPIGDVARKVSEIIEGQRHEQAMLMSLAPRTRTAGFENISMVYDHMATDHDRLADFASDWLRQRGFSVPAERAEVQVSNMSPEESIDHVMQMHVDGFNKHLAARQGESSSTVRGLRLWAAATTARHISLLRTLDSDVEFGRRTASARLRAQMAGGIVDSTTMARIYEEDMEIFRRLTAETTTLAQQPQPMHVVEVVRIEERVVQAPAPEQPRVVEQPAPPPAPIVRQVTPMRSQVAPSRQTTRRRRPAK